MHKIPIYFWIFIIVVEMVYLLTPYRVVEPSLNKYVVRFENHVKRFCSEDQYFNPNQILVRKMYLPSTYIGRCRLALHGYTIDIDNEFWMIADEDDRYQLIAHELTHCMFRTGHSDNYNNYMYPTFSSMNDFMLNYQIDEFLTKRCKK